MWLLAPCAGEEGNSHSRCDRGHTHTVPSPCSSKNGVWRLQYSFFNIIATPEDKGKWYEIAPNLTSWLAWMTHYCSELIINWFMSSPAASYMARSTARLHWKASFIICSGGMEHG